MLRTTSHIRSRTKNVFRILNLTYVTIPRLWPYTQLTSIHDVTSMYTHTQSQPRVRVQSTSY